MSDRNDWNHGQPPPEISDPIWWDGQWHERKDWMPEHYTKNTIECTTWCPQCGRLTQHRLDGGRQGPCIDKDHGDKSPTRKGRPGERPFRVYFIATDANHAHKDFRDFDEALLFFTRQPPGTATLWRTDRTAAKQLR